MKRNRPLREELHRYIVRHFDDDDIAVEKEIQIENQNQNEIIDVDESDDFVINIEEFV